MSAAEVRFEIKNLPEARAALRQVGGDFELLKRHMQAQNVAARDQQILIQALKREYDHTRRAALGVSDALKPLRQRLREAVTEAGGLRSQLEQVRQGLDSFADSGEGVGEVSKKVIALMDDFSALKEKMDLFNKPAQFSALQRNIGEISQATGIPQRTLAAAVAETQDKMSAGSALALDNEGSLLMRLATAARAARAPDIPGFIASSVKTATQLKMTPEEAARMPAIVRTSEQLGSLTAKQLQGSEFGSPIAQLAALRGTKGEQAWREGVGLAQAIAAGPGGSEKAANYMENMLAKIVDPEYRKRISKATGVKMLDEGGNLRHPALIFDEIEEARKKGTLTKAKDYEVWKDMQAREGFFAGSANRAKMRQIEAAPVTEGERLIRDSFHNQLSGLQGRMDLQKVRNEAEELRNAPAEAMVKAADITTQFKARHPWWSAGLEPAAEFLDRLKPGVGLGLYGGVASRMLMEAVPAEQNRENVLMERERRIAAERSTSTAARSTGAGSMGAQGPPPFTLVINNFVAGDLPARVTNTAIPSSARAKGPPRDPTRGPGTGRR